MDWHAIQKMKVTDLRDKAKEFGAESTTGMKKEQLVEFIAEKMGVERPKKDHHAHHGTLSKAQLKDKITSLKQERVAARSDKNRKRVALLRKRIHAYKRQMREAE